MKNRRCPNHKCCWDYGDCETCDLGNHILKLHKRIDRLKKQNENLTIERNAGALTAKALNNKWIPITSEKKPRHLRNYFIAFVFGDSDMHFFSEAKYHAYGGNGIVEGPHFSNEGVDGMRVTHWMPIPTLPKEVEDVNT